MYPAIVSESTPMRFREASPYALFHPKVQSTFHQKLFQLWLRMVTSQNSKTNLYHEFPWCQNQTPTFRLKLCQQRNACWSSFVLNQRIVAFTTHGGNMQTEFSEKREGVVCFPGEMCTRDPKVKVIWKGLRCEHQCSATSKFLMNWFHNWLHVLNTYLFEGPNTMINSWVWRKKIVGDGVGGKGQSNGPHSSPLFVVCNTGWYI